jgi:hypothetical protein
MPLRCMQIASILARVPLLLLFPFGVLPAQTALTAPVSVFVADGASGTPLVQARVEFPLLGLSDHTDLFGVAYFRALKTGVVRLKVSKIGYVPLERDITLEFHSATAIELSVAMMTIGPVHSLDTVKVSGTATYFSLLSGFEQRRHLGFGKFFTAAQLDSSPHESVADLIARRVPGLRVEWSQSRMRARLVSLRGPISIQEGQCLVQAYVDNNKANDEDLAHIQSGDVLGLEYYSIAPPPQYLVTAPCGVLLIWTRR